MLHLFFCPHQVEVEVEGHQVPQEKVVVVEGDLLVHQMEEGVEGGFLVPQEVVVVVVVGEEGFLMEGEGLQGEVEHPRKNTMQLHACSIIIETDIYVRIYIYTRVYNIRI